MSFPRPFLSLLPRRSCLSCTHLHYARTEVAIALLFPNGLPPSSAPSAPFFRDIDIALRIDEGDAFSRAETDRARGPHCGEPLDAIDALVHLRISRFSLVAIAAIRPRRSSSRSPFPQSALPPSQAQILMDARHFFLQILGKGDETREESL